MVCRDVIHSCFRLITVFFWVWKNRIFSSMLVWGKTVDEMESSKSLNALSMVWTREFSRTSSSVIFVSSFERSSAFLNEAHEARKSCWEDRKALNDDSSSTIVFGFAAQRYFSKVSFRWTFSGVNHPSTSISRIQFAMIGRDLSAVATPLSSALPTRRESCDPMI